MPERNVVFTRWVAHVIVTRIEMVTYDNKRFDRDSPTVPLSEEIQELETRITQDSIAGAVGSAIAILEIRCPDPRKETEARERDS